MYVERQNNNKLFHNLIRHFLIIFQAMQMGNSFACEYFDSQWRVHVNLKKKQHNEQAIYNTNHHNLTLSSVTIINFRSHELSRALWCIGINENTMGNIFKHFIPTGLVRPMLKISLDRTNPIQCAHTFSAIHFALASTKLRLDGFRLRITDCNDSFCI